MARQELVDWCRNYLASGYNEQQLKDYLLKQGYDAAEVNDAVKAAMDAQPKPPAQQAPKAQPAPAQKPAATAPVQKAPAAVQKPQPAAQPAPQPVPVVQKPTPAPAPAYVPVQVPISSQAEAPAPQPSGIPFLAIGVALVLVIFAVGVFYVATSFNLFGNLTAPGNTSVVEASTPEEPPPSVKPPVQEPPVKAPASCSDLACFNGYFKTCEQATFLYGGQDVAIQYATVGPVAGDCEVTARYDSYSNSTFVGKEMSCVYDNSADFAPGPGMPNATCSGELYTLLLQESLRAQQAAANCSLKPLLAQAQIDSGLQMQKGISTYITVTGFKGKNSDVSWSSQDAAVATVGPTSGATVIAKAISPGQTTLVATDNGASPPCSTYIKINVSGTQPPAASTNPVIITTVLAGIGGNVHLTVTNAGASPVTVKAVTIANETHQVDWPLAPHDQAELIVSGACMGKNGTLSLGSARFSYLDAGVAKTGTQDNVRVDCGYAYNY